MTTPTLSSTMPAELRSAVRAALVAQAVRDAVTEQHTMAHPIEPTSRPRIHQRRMALGIAAVGVVAVAGGAVLVTVRSTSSEPYAGWSAVPRTALAAGAPVPRDFARWASQCNDIVGGGVALQGSPSRPASARHDVLVDRRGDFTFCVDVSVGHGTPADPFVATAGLRGPDTSKAG